MIQKQEQQQQQLNITLIFKHKGQKIKYETSAVPQMTFYDTIQACYKLQNAQQQKKKIIYPKQQIKITLTVENNKIYSFLPDQKLQKLKQKCSNMKQYFLIIYNIEQQSQHKEVNINYKGIKLNKIFHQQQNVNQIIDQIKFQFHLNAQTKLQTKIRNANQQEKKINGQETVKLLKKRYGNEFVVLINPINDKAIQQKIQLREKSPNFKDKQNNNKKIQVTLQLRDLDKSVQIQRKYPSLYSFNDILDKLKPQFKKYFFDEIGQQYKLIVQDLNNKGNQFIKLDQPLVRLFQNCQKKSFSVIKNYPGG